MNRLADPNVPGAQKVDLIENAKPDEAEAIDSLGRALNQSGYAPATFEVTDVRWGEGTRGSRVLATVTLKTENPQAGNFSYPMEFNLADNRWQLTRESADTLLESAEEPAAPPTPTP